MFFLDIFFEGLFANFEKVYTFASANKRVGDLLNIVLWCNGNTTDSGPVCPGSNPGRTTLKKPRYSIRVARLFVVDIMFLFVTKPFGHLLYTGFLTIHENAYTVYFGGKPSKTDG